MDLDSGVDTCKQPNPEPVAPENVCLILFFIYGDTVFWNAYQMIICTVLIVVIFLGLINHNME